MTDRANDLAALERQADRLDTSPGWITRERPIFWPEPRPKMKPAHWRYLPIRAALESAAKLVDLSLAERRILALRNPEPGTDFATTNTLSLSYQYMLPGERASTHRHTPHALRVMIDAEGTYSIVDGVRMPMESGDIVLTPGGCWHGHGHDGSRAACWIDALDIPLTQMLEPMSFEPYPGRHMAETSRADVSPMRTPAGYIQALLTRSAEVSPGFKRVILPAEAMPTMGLAVLALAGGSTTPRVRSTASRAYVILAGRGTTTIGETMFQWSSGDVVAVPGWSWCRHAAQNDCRLVEISDEPLMRACRYYRDETDHS